MRAAILVLVMALVWPAWGANEKGMFVNGGAKRGQVAA